MPSTTVKQPKKQGGRKARADIKVASGNTMRKPDYYIKVETVMGNVEVYWIQVDAKNDAYQAHLHKAIEEDSSWHELGFVAIARRRVNPQIDDFLLNEKNQYPRKVMVRVLEPDEVSTQSGRQEILMRIKQFCMQPSNNRFGYDYIVDKTSDLTPDDPAHLARLDSYLQDTTICNVIKGIYEKPGTDWYRNNKEMADMFWSGPQYPEIACTELGYPRPVNTTNNGAFASTYNTVNELPVADSHHHDGNDLLRRSGRHKKITSA